VDTAILAALIGAAATIGSTWITRWQDKSSRTPPAVPESGYATGDLSAAPPMAPTPWKVRAGYLTWDAVRLVVRNLSLFGLFIALIYSAQALGIGHTPPKEPKVFGMSHTDQSLMLSLMIGCWAAGGLGVAEALTRWSPWKR